ncbi:zinc ABC transporter ATP-binding protein AztA [Okibacterium endophyticum]
MRSEHPRTRAAAHEALGESSSEASGVVVLRDVGVWHRGEAVFSGVHLEIRPGGITVLTGPNGAGKSTLLDVIAGIRRPDRGTVVRSHGGRPAYLVQRSAVTDALPITVRDAVGMGRWAHLGAWRAPRARDRDIVTGWMHRLGLAHLAARPLSSLSGGQRQRVLLAQALAQQPRLLLLDEPATSLDAEGKALLPGILRDCADAGAAVVHATHDPDVTADWIVRIEPAP